MKKGTLAKVILGGAGLAAGALVGSLLFKNKDKQAEESEANYNEADVAEMEVED